MSIDVTTFIQKIRNEVLVDGNQEITLETELAKLEGWDSLTKMALIVMVEDSYGKTLKYVDVDKSKTLSDLLVLTENQ